MRIFNDLRQECGGQDYQAWSEGWDYISTASGWVSADTLTLGIAALMPLIVVGVALAARHYVATLHREHPAE